MEHLPIKKSYALQELANVSLIPSFIEEETNLANHSIIPFSKISTIGVAFEPLANAFQNLFLGGAGKSGLYRVTVPNGGTLAQFHGENSFLGSVLTPNGAVGGGQARLNPLVCNPAMLFMAFALNSIDKKLDKIQEFQMEILDFLVQQHRAELKGDLIFLSDVLTHYKLNWNNEKYKSSNHIKVLDIRQAAEKNIIFSQGQINANIQKKSLLHIDQDVTKQLLKIQSGFSDYQLALYSFAFSSFVEILLLENFEEPYLNAVVNKISDYSDQYDSLYASSYDQLENYSKTSIQSRLLKGLSNVSSAAGKKAEKISLFSKSKIDEKLLNAGDKIEEFGESRLNKTMQKIVEKKSSYIQPFIDNINMVNHLFNHTSNVLFDNENIYIEDVVMETA